MSCVSIIRITSNGLKSTPNITEPEKVIEMNGHIIGMTISPDKDFLFVNVRGWPENAVPNQDQAPAINENIELKIINLKTLEFESEVNAVVIIFLDFYRIKSISWLAVFPFSSFFYLMSF